ncbi:MAG: hypothetical protein RIT27_163 [Pseudomonadota bacterium]|jgi:NADH pyrophosphatase NudC (nudix superfamily)
MNDDRNSHAYQSMMQHLRDLTHWKSLRDQLDQAVEKVVTLEELTREEADKISDYIQRDVEDAAKFIVETRQDLAAWLRFDINLLEEKLLEMFKHAVDHTQLELNKLADQAEIATHWHSSEIIGLGTLQCEQCGKLLHFQKPAKIPLCPQCQHNQFSRLWENEHEPLQN